jgi:hypothetical protein
MPYEFQEWEEEPEALASSARIGGPPRKSAGLGVLDPPGPPKRPSGPLAGRPAFFLTRLFAGLVLAGLGLIILFLLFAR